MARETYVYDRASGKMIPKGEWLRRGSERPRRKSCNVIRDCMDSILNHADGRMYDSKRAYEKAVRAKGCEIVGGMCAESYVAPKDYGPSVAHDVQRAIAELRGR